MLQAGRLYLRHTNPLPGTEERRIPEIPITHNKEKRPQYADASDLGANALSPLLRSVPLIRHVLWDGPGSTLKVPWLEHLAQNIEIISAYKWNPNLRDILVRVKLPSPSAQPGSPGRCRTVTNPTTKIPYFLKKSITMKHCNCVYKIHFRHCKIIYVGETRNSLSARLSAHSYNICTGRKSNTFLVKHFMAHGLQNL